MSTFLFEDALSEKGMKRKDLPEKIQHKINELAKLCKELDATDDEDEKEIDRLNNSIDYMDEKIAEEITSLGTGDPAPDPTPNPDPDPAPKEKDNTLATVGIIGAFGLLLWGAFKIFGGKK